MVVAALALDPLFNSHMHYGRMEPVTLFFALTSIFVVLKAMSSSYRNSRSILLYALAGLLFSLALLTTPRVGVLLLGLGITQVYYLLKKPSNARALQLVVFSGSVVLVYVCWIFVAFGSLHNLVNYYLDFHGYIGGGFSFPKQQIPLIFITTVSGIAWGLVSYKRRMPELIVFSMVSAILYYSLVHDTGTYSLLILPACYTIIGSSVALLLKQRSLKSYSRLLVAAPILTIVLFNLLFFTIKFFTIYNTLDSRDPKYIDAFIKSYIPPNSKVIGDEIYYYAVSSANSDFQYIHLYKDDISREHYQRKIYGYDFIVMSHDLNRDRPELLQLYQRNSDLVKIAEFTQLSDNNFPLIDKVSSFFRVTVRSSYDCTIYKRVKEGKRLRTYFPVE
ncbi:hypothetical protein CLV24_12635 [Pontibacter ummariensis]|uniref:Dolichyl-phosphate-mannose-protein mannosyltransferase n=2 Tax=Pontibacter ummariensis TaxID=1610492 RepID=A0A239K4E1_9BACT|nr:hypothetical protein CLV24_12635 [Pontibacter ummariensis]SNT13015.1 hypothetical protein SAMN06296052_12618 [Pontibacter ummariensis]